jgi:hypothetical protein
MKTCIFVALLFCLSWGVWPANAVSLPVIPDGASDGVWFGPGTTPVFMFESSESGTIDATLPIPLPFVRQVGLIDPKTGQISDLVASLGSTLALISDPNDAGLPQPGSPFVPLDETGTWMDLSQYFSQPVWVFSDIDVTVTPTVTPLPGTLPLMGTVLGAGYLISRWRRRRSIGSAALTAA